MFRYTPAQALAFVKALRVIDREQAAMQLAIAAQGARGKDVDKLIQEWMEPVDDEI